MNNKKEFVQKGVIVISFVMLPLICCYILCWMNAGIGLSEISLLGNTGNDEVVYYKMVDGIVNFDIPRGYFGYNESHAVVGTFSTWSPILLLFWAIWGKIFGWNLWSPIICNIVLLMVAMGIFAIVAKPNLKQSIRIMGMYFVCQFITCNALMTLPEVSLYFLVIIFAGILINLSRIDSYWRIKLIFAYIVVILLTWMRPYWGVLLLLPSYELIKHCGKKQYGITISLMILLFTGGVYIFINKNMCAPFLTPLFNFSWISLIVDNPIGGTVMLISKFLQALRQFLIMTKDGALGMGAGAGCAGFLVIFACFFYQLRKALREKNEDSIIRYGILLIFMFLTFYAAALIFGMDSMEKHFLEFIVLGIFIIGFNYKGKMSRNAFILLCWIFMIARINTPLENNEEEMENVKSGKAQLGGGNYSRFQE